MTEDQTPPMSRPRVAAGALFFDEPGRVLLVKPTYKDGWDIPGGYVEPGESPLRACHREVQEELGIEVALDRLLVVDWAPSQQEGDKILFIFDGGQLTCDIDDLELDTSEVIQAQFFATSSLHELLNRRLLPRILEAAHARSVQRPAYLEHGFLPGESTLTP